MNQTFLRRLSDGTPEAPNGDIDQRKEPTIARIWRGRVAAARADEYAKYLYEHGIRPLEEKALAVELLREDRAGESEFITISYWEDVEAMSRFAGKDPRRIHHLERDPEFLIELPKAVQVLEYHRLEGCVRHIARHARSRLPGRRGCGIARG